jgi:hypothetical protein
MTCQDDTWPGGEKIMYLEKVIDDEAMLACEKPKTSPKKKALNAMSHGSHTCKLMAYPETPVCN